jgi:hypothetical protein
MVMNKASYARGRKGFCSSVFLYEIGTIALLSSQLGQMILLEIVNKGYNLLKKSSFAKKSKKKMK